MRENGVSRREVIAGLAAATGGFAVSAGRLNGQQYHIAGSNLKLGVASYSFRKFSREKAIEMTKEIGTPYMNIKDVHLPLDRTAEQIAAAKKEFDDAGIVLVGCGTVYFKSAEDSDIRPKFEYAKRVGFPLMVSMPNRDVLPHLEKYVKEYDIKVAVHNHGPEDKNFPTPQSVLEVVKNLDPRMGLCIDIGHTSRTGVDVVQSIAQAGPRLLDMHFKDLANPMGKESQVAVGRGKLPIPAIFRQLIKMRYDGCVNLEYEILPDNPMPGMLESFGYERGVLAAIAADRSV